MQKKRTIDDLTEADIRLLLRVKSRMDRQKHLAAYRQTGRAIILVRDTQPDNFSQHFLEFDDFDVNNTTQSQPNIRLFFANHLLGFLEIGAMIAIIVLFWFSWRSLANFNQRASAAWVFPTPTPTALIQAVVLPDGHTPPNSIGGARPRDEEIPAHLKPIAQVYANLPAPTPAPHQGNRIQIPALNIDAPIVQGDGWEQLMKGVAQHLGTANPGEKGNMVLSGHNDVYGEVFRYLDRLKPGDQIVVFTSTQSHTYIVKEWKLVAPDQVEVMAPTPNETLTLISCYPYLVDTQRIAVKATLLKK